MQPRLFGEAKEEPDNSLLGLKRREQASSSKEQPHGYRALISLSGICAGGQKSRHLHVQLPARMAVQEACVLLREQKRKLDAPSAY